MPTRGGVGQIHRDLGVLDAPGGAGVLALHPDRMRALLHIAGLVKDQDRAGVAEGVDDIVAQIVADRLGVPFRPRQQVLQPVRGGIAAVFGDRPAILAVQARDHPSHQLGGMAQRFVAGKTRRDPVDHRRELRPPPIRVYAMSRGDRGQFWMSSQTPNNAAVTAPTSADTPQHPQSRTTAAVLVRVRSTVFRVQIRVHHTRQERFSIARCSAVTSSRLCWVSV